MRIKEEKPPGNEDMDLELPKDSENMIDRFLNHTSHATLLTTTHESLLPPSTNENKGHLFVMSCSNAGNTSHLRLLDNITLPDRRLPNSI